jgi:hypothetical protein
MGGKTVHEFSRMHVWCTRTPKSLTLGIATPGDIGLPDIRIFVVPFVDGFQPGTSFCKTLDTSSVKIALEGTFTRGEGVVLLAVDRMEKHGGTFVAFS